jgi:sarcosine oxidase subunit delta
MRIKCPCCGERSLDEYLYHGDATVRRPDPSSPTALSEFTAYVYERRNPRGAHRELWYHAAGCHSWLVVERNTATHAISSVQLAKDVALADSADERRSA